MRNKRVLILRRPRRAVSKDHPEEAA